MALEIAYVSGNKYRISDDEIIAEVEMFGGGRGMAINLRSIKATASASHGIRADPEAQIKHLGEELIASRRFRSFVIGNKGLVVASTNHEAPVGSRIPTKVVSLPPSA